MVGGFSSSLQPLDALDKTAGPAVRQVVAIDRGDDDVLELHRDDRLGQLPRLVGIEGLRPAVGDRTVGAVPGAHAAVDQKGRRAPRKALGAVGATRLLAHRVQTARTHLSF